MSLAALAVAFVLPPTVAATFAVDSVADEIDAGPGDGLCAGVSTACTLRAAVQEANAFPGADRIDVASGTYVLAIPGVEEDAAATGDLDVTEALSIVGAGAGTTVIDGAGLDRILHVLSGAPTGISGLTFTGGDASASARYFGGAAWAEASLDATDCAFTANRAGQCGAIALLRGGSVDRCVFSENVAPEYGGALGAYGTTLVTDSVFLRNDSQSGGAVVAGGDLTIVGCSFQQNTASGAFGRGGALHVSRRTVVVLDSTFEANHSDGDGGAIAGADGVLFRLELRRVSISGGSADNEGGAIWMRKWENQTSSIDVFDSTISGNSAARGGSALFVFGESASATLVNSTLSGNDGSTIRLMSSTSLIALNSTVVSDTIALASESLSVAQLGASILKGPLGSDCQGSVVSLGHNIFAQAPACPLAGDPSTDLLDVDPLLGPLQDNGGPTLTHAPLPGSPAIDSAADTCVDELRAPLLADQRGDVRPMDGDLDGTTGCDVGAVEIAACGPDSDADTLGDICDCAPADPASLRVPGEGDLRVACDVATGDALVSWQDLAPQAGTGTLYEVASSSIGTLWTTRVADGPCVATGVAVGPWADARAISDRGWYYLVRGTNACGPAPAEGWGRDSLGAERPACP